MKAARAVVWPWVDAGAEALIACARERGYAVLYAGATARLPVRWGTFEDYVASRSKAVRRTVRADLSAFRDAGLHAVAAEDFRAAAPAMEALYREAYRRRNERDPRIPAGCFERLAETPTSGLFAQLTWSGERLVGCSINLAAAGVLEGTFAAFAAGHEGGPAYLNDLVYHPLRVAIRERMRRHRPGQLGALPEGPAGRPAAPAHGAGTGERPADASGAAAAGADDGAAAGGEGAAHAGRALVALVLRRRPGRGVSRLARYVRDCRTFPADARIAWSNEGWRGVWEAIATRTLRKVLRGDRMILFAQGLDDLPEVGSPDGVTIARLQPRELPMLAYLVSRRDLDAFRALLAAGRIGVVAWRGGRAVGYAWMAERLAPDVTRCPIPLPEEAVYLWDLYVLPAERGRGIGSALAAERLAIARELGYQEGWRMIAPRNLPSLRTLRAGGSTRIVGEIRFVQLLSLLRARFLPARFRV